MTKVSVPFLLMWNWNVSQWAVIISFPVTWTYEKELAIPFVWIV